MKLIRWTLWSRGHLAMLVCTCAATLLLLSVGASLLTHGGPAPARAAHPVHAHKPTRTRAPLPTPSQSPTPAASDKSAPAETAPASPERTRKVVARARAFTRAWLHTGKGWDARVHVQVTPDLWSTIRLSNQAHIPRAHYVSTRVESADHFSAAAEVQLSNGDRLREEFLWTGHQWLVSDLLPAEQDH